MVQLRGYQVNVINETYKAWTDGHRNVLLQLATGAGKTVIFSKIIAQNDGTSVAIAHRSELVSQISLALARYGVRHNLIAQDQTKRDIVSIHINELGQNFYDPHAKCHVASVDTLLNIKSQPAWFKHVSLVVQDEGHHPLRLNKWGRAADLFPNAYGLYPTATPLRADGKGLGRHADGIIDKMILGPSMRDLIKLGFLTDYRIFATHRTVDLSNVPVTASGDYSPEKLRRTVHASKITGDVVEHYLKFAKGKLGVTFAVDIEAAEEIAFAYKAAGVRAEVVSSKTPDALRARIMQGFRDRKIEQLVNVDLLGEGVDVPAIEVVSFARPTQSFALYSQQFGRALRTIEGKDHAIIIDHVDNVIRHGLPDAKRTWSLDRRDRRSTSRITEVPLRHCINPQCLAVYDRVHKSCPYCSTSPAPVARTSAEFVDGDLLELDAETLDRMRGEIDKVDDAPRIPQYLDPYAQQAVAKRHRKRQEAQAVLRDAIAQWAGYLKAQEHSDSEIYRNFYFKFGMDVMHAQTLNATRAEELTAEIKKHIDVMSNNY